VAPVVDCVPSLRRYLQHLLVPWKLISFASATALVTLAAPYGHDRTWDTTDSLLISALVFAVGPWSVAIFYRDVARGRCRLRTLIAFLVFWVPCWCYDLYILWRDGEYPVTALSNLAVSGPITLLAGLFWNLGRSPSERSMFSFRWRIWPPEETSSWRTILLPAALLAVPVLYAIALCVLWPLWGIP
jgi:hypothetical protein